MKIKILILLIIISLIPMTATAQLAESDHPYANNFAYTWPAITESGATQMRLHFTKIDLNGCDIIRLLDKDGRVLVEYGDGFCAGKYLKEDFWTEWFTTDTLKVKLETNGEGTTYGFLIDQKQTRQTVAPTTANLAESYHPYSNNFAYTWPAITESGATQMRLHFTKVDLNGCDIIRLLDKDGRVLVEYGDGFCAGKYLKEDFWTEWFTTDTLKVKLETNGEGTTYGFLIDQKETRLGTPTPTTPTPTSTITPAYTTPAPSPTPTSTLMSISNIALGKPVSVTTNGVDERREGSGQMPPQAITDGSLDGVVGYVNDDYNQLMTVNVNIDLQGTYRIKKIRYNIGNVQRAETWNADIMDSPFGRVATNPGSPYSGAWTEQTGDLVASNINIKFEKTRTAWEKDWLFIGEIEVYGTPISTEAPTYTSQPPNVPDSSPPSISLSKQIVDFNKNGQLEEGEKLVITFGADDESGVKSIKVLVDGNLIDLRNSQGTYSVTTDSLSMGDHSIVVEAIDSKDNKKSEKMNITAARLGPSVYFPKLRYEVNEGEDFNVVLSAVNPIGNPKMEALLVIKPPGNGVSIYESWCKGLEGMCTGKYDIESGDTIRSNSMKIHADKAGEYPIDAEVYYQFDGGQRSPTRYETLTLVVIPKQTPNPTNTQAPSTPGFEILLAIGGLIALYCTRHLKRAKKKGQN